MKKMIVREGVEITTTINSSNDVLKVINTLVELNYENKKCTVFMIENRNGLYCTLKGTFELLKGSIYCRLPSSSEYFRIDLALCKEVVISTKVHTIDLTLKSGVKIVVQANG